MNRIGILHYSAPPVIGGVENVIQAHTRLLVEAGYPTTILSGRGKQAKLPPGAKFIQIAELDSRHPQILELSQELEQGHIPRGFDAMVDQLTQRLRTSLGALDVVIVHNVFTKHFNLPFTAALFQLLDQGAIPHCIAWCHDISWSSPRSRSKVYPGYPWDFLRTYRSDVTYVTVSRNRQRELSELYGCHIGQIQVIYNGVDPEELLALSDTGQALVKKLNLWDNDLNLLLPVRVTHAKNIELAMQVAAILKARGLQPKLIVTGPPDPHDPNSMEYFQELLALRESLDVVEELRFIYESGPGSREPFLIDMHAVADLLRVCDGLFMPSHYEGFGMSILEAGLAGLPIFCANTIPAAREIAAQSVVMFSPEASPKQVAELIIQGMDNPVHYLRRRIRQSLNWNSIFQHEILPLLGQGAS